MKFEKIEKYIFKNEKGRYSFIIENKTVGRFKYTNTDLKKVLQVKEYFLKHGRIETIKKFNLFRGKDIVVKQLAINTLLDKTLYANNKSGYDGIYWVESRKKWRVRIQLAHERKSIGEFKTLEAAIRARNLARKKGINWILENKKEVNGVGK